MAKYMSKAMLEGERRVAKLWQKASGEGHGERSLAKGMAKGQWPKAWRKASGQRHGGRPVAKGMEKCQRRKLWRNASGQRPVAKGMAKCQWPKAWRKVSGEGERRRGAYGDGGHMAKGIRQRAYGEGHMAKVYGVGCDGVDDWFSAAMVSFSSALGGALDIHFVLSRPGFYLFSSTSPRAKRAERAKPADCDLTSEDLDVWTRALDTCLFWID
eukprot:1391458-Amorphochlora_amoeboformis.AAC.1